MDGLVILALGIMIHVIRDSSILNASNTKLVLKISTEGQHKEDICYPCIQHLDPTLGIYLYYSNRNGSFSCLSINIILPLLWISLEIDNFTIVRALLRSGYCNELTVHVFLLILVQICFEIILVYLWFHLNSRPNGVIFRASPWLPYYNIPILTIPTVELYYYTTYLSLIYLG